MKTEQTTKQFDAVKMMRDIRNRIDEETKDMAFEEFKKYISEKLRNSELKNLGRITSH
ncbi:MAG: hypothetical protein HY960_11680 [Ignavibacteriae bacterium]|nr:hypothetical protein [Ignavibacteriota bacterium]